MNSRRKAVVCFDPVESPSIFLAVIWPISASQTRTAVSTRFEHRFEVESRAADDFENIGGGGLLLQQIRAVR